MTFTIIGACEQTGKIGIGLATLSLAGGGIAPFFTSRGDIISSQAYGQPRLGIMAVKLLEEGLSFADLKRKLEEYDPFFSYRQIGILKRSGEIFVYTGNKTRPWAGHRIGRNYLVLGNVLAGEHVISAMASAFENSQDPLAERLLLALEAGRDAGGQVGPSGEHFTERSAAIRVLSEGCCAELDLRVDVHPDALNELRRIYAIYKPYIHYNRLRAEDPPNTPPMIEWEKQDLQENLPPPAIR